MKIGCHVSIAGGIINAPKRAADLGCEVFQMFTRSPQGGPAPVITPEIAKQFKEEMKKWKQENCYIHTPYYINFASANKATRESSARIVREELERGSLIGAKYVMTHLGSSTSLTASSSKDFAREEALKMTAEGIGLVLEGYKGTTKLLLEISAGAGNIIGDTFEELGYILTYDAMKYHKLGICLDSAHMFASGYDIKKDRHDHIGHGKIGEMGFVNLMSTFPDTDFICETRPDLVKEDMEKLKGLRYTGQHEQHNFQ